MMPKSRLRWQASSTSKNPDFKGVQFEAKARDVLASLGPQERQDAVRKLMGFADFEPRFKALSHHPKLLDLITRILGEEPKMFQDMALLKPPKVGREKPWHQDHVAIFGGEGKDVSC